MVEPVVVECKGHSTLVLLISASSSSKPPSVPISANAHRPAGMPHAAVPLTNCTNPKCKPPRQTVPTLPPPPGLTRGSPLRLPTVFTFNQFQLLQLIGQAIYWG